jgi:hypothetical protein
MQARFKLRSRGDHAHSEDSDVSQWQSGRQTAAVSVDPALQQDIDAFLGQLDDLLVEHLGKYVIFKDARFVRAFDSLDAALRAGQQYGTSSFLVQRVEPLRERLDFHAACRV